MIDFLIIGGGIAGISAGARLSHLGQVTVLEQEDALAYHASGRSAALFEQNYGKPSTVALNTASRDYLTTANGGVLSPRGIMIVAGADRADDFAHDIKTMKLDPISMAQAMDLWPILNPETVDRAGYNPDAQDIDADLLIQNFAREIRANGGDIRTKSAVTAIQKTTTGWRVSAGEAFEARMIINAAGAWVDQIAEMAGIAPLGVSPLRRSFARLPAPNDLDVSRWPMLFGPGEDWYAKPDAGAMLVSPADEDLVTPHDAWADDMVLAEGLARYEHHVTCPVTQVTANWAGLRTFAPDRELVIGPDAVEPTFFWLAGQGGYGMQSSPAVSQLAADLIGGMTSELPTDVIERLRPNRFG